MGIGESLRAWAGMRTPEEEAKFKAEHPEQEMKKLKINSSVLEKRRQEAERALKGDDPEPQAPQGPKM